MSFDIYLSTLELIIKPKTDFILAIEFFTRFDPTLWDRIEISGRDMLFMNRQKIVVFAQYI